MRTRLILTAVAALALAACSSGTTAAPSPTAAAPSPSSVVTPAAVAPLPSPAASVAAVPVKVHFDGQRCTYLGPEAFPAGTLVDFQFSATPETADLVALVISGVTKDVPVDVLDRALPVTGVPSWALETHEAFLGGPGSMLFTMIYRDASEVAVFVGCVTAPEANNTLYPAALLWAIPG
jgi:hypothetical protein